MGEAYQEEAKFDSDLVDRTRVLQERVYAKAEELLRQLPARVFGVACQDCPVATQATLWCPECVAPFCEACCRRVHDPRITSARRFHEFVAWVKWACKELCASANSRRFSSMILNASRKR